MSLHVPAEQSDRVEAWRGSDQLAHVRLKGLTNQMSAPFFTVSFGCRGRNDEGHGTSLMKRRFSFTEFALIRQLAI
jgi:hypothetical protein